MCDATWTLAAQVESTGRFGGSSNEGAHLLKPAGSAGTKQTFDDSDDEEEERPAKKAKVGSALSAQAQRRRGIRNSDRWPESPSLRRMSVTGHATQERDNVHRRRLETSAGTVEAGQALSWFSRWSPRLLHGQRSRHEETTSRPCCSAPH